MFIYPVSFFSLPPTHYVSQVEFYLVLKVRVYKADAGDSYCLGDTLGLRNPFVNRLSLLVTMRVFLKNKNSINSKHLLSILPSCALTKY